MCVRGKRRRRKNAKETEITSYGSQAKKGGGGGGKGKEIEKERGVKGGQKAVIVSEGTTERDRENGSSQGIFFFVREEKHVRVSLA